MEPTHFESLYPQDSRSDEVKKVLSFIKQGDSCQVLSLPGVGKSNLLSLLAYNSSLREKHLGDIRKWFHFVLLDFSEIKGRPLLDTIKYMFLTLADSLKERERMEEHTKIQELFKEHLSLNDELVLFQGLKKALDYLAIEKELTVTLLCDRFDEYIPSVTRDFFANLTVLRNRAKYRFSVVFALTRPLEEIVDSSTLSEFYEFVANHHVYLSLVDKPSLDFRLSYIQKVTEKTVPQEVLKKITTLTGGHGKLTRLCLESALHQDTISTDSNESFVHNSSIAKALLDIWNSLTPSEQKMITDKKVIGEYLEKVGLIRGQHITIPLFEEFLHQHVSLHKNLSLTYDEKTNDILKGSTVLTEKLTSSEFRLLKFLIENKDRVLERQEIIDVVWGETASTVGVTDQAIDQLVFRLRRKIEDDPNSPLHVHTIKGRGLRFTP